MVFETIFGAAEELFKLAFRNKGQSDNMTPSDPGSAAPSPKQAKAGAPDLKPLREPNRLPPPGPGVGHDGIDFN